MPDCHRPSSTHPRWSLPDGEFEVSWVDDLFERRASLSSSVAVVASSSGTKLSSSETSFEDGSAVASSASLEVVGPASSWVPDSPEAADLSEPVELPAGAQEPGSESELAVDPPEVSSAAQAVAHSNDAPTRPTKIPASTSTPRGCDCRCGKSQGTTLALQRRQRLSAVDPG